MEQSFLAYLRGRCRSLPQVRIGIGDDAAVIDAPSSNGMSIVACTDQIIDGVDFDAAQHALKDIGYKSMAINLSDIAAMGATPISALVTLSLPRSNATRTAGDVYEGIFEAAEKYSVAISGGDISTYEGPLAISVTLLGEVAKQREWLRSGAQDGDAILVTGPLGGSILGRHLRPTPRLDISQQLAATTKIHAAIDISDGFSLDLDRLCASSRVGAEIEMAKIPIHADAVRRSEITGLSAQEHAWSDGEDFELILALSQNEADDLLAGPLGESLVQVGNITGRTGLWSREVGKLTRMTPRGYLH